MREIILQNARLLIVDDNAANIQLLSDILREEGYGNIQSTRDPHTARDLYGAFQPDLILLDMDMPHLDSFHVLEQLRSLIPQATYLPILIVSRDGSSEAKRRALASGASDFLTQPVDVVEITQRIGNLLDTRFLHLQLQEQHRLLQEHHDQLAEKASELENRVSQRTTELAVANEQLRAEIAEHQRAQKDLQESHNLLCAITEGSDEAIFVKDLEGRYLMMNATGACFRGMAPEDVIGKADTDLFSPESARLFREADRHILAVGTTETCEQTTIEDGKTRTHLVTKGVYRNQQGEAIGIFGIARDITARKQLEAELEAREHYFRALIEHSGDGIALTDASGTCHYLSQAASRITGYSEDEALNQSAFEFVHPDDQEAMRLALTQNLLQPGGSVVTECRVRHRDGSWRWIENVSTNLLAEPSVQGIVSNFRDVTERRQTQQELQVRTHQQAAVAALGLRALRGDDFATLLNDAVALIAQTLEVEYCKVSELLPDGQTLLLRAGVGWKEGCVGHATVGAEGTSQAGYTLLSQEPVIVDDLRTETRFSGPLLLHEHGVISGMSVIIHDPGQDRPFGVLGAHTKRQRAFTTNDVHFLQAMANVLATTLKRQREEEALRQSEKRFRRLFETAQDGILLLDAVTCKITDVNPFIVKLLGYSREEFLGRELFEIGLLKDAASAEAFRELQSSGYIRYENLPLQTKDGKCCEVEFVSNMDAENGHQVIQCNVRDFTERKQAERALRASEARFHAFMNHSPVAAFIKDEDGRYLYVNETVERVFQLNLGDVTGNTDFDFLPEATARQFHINDLQVLTTGQVAEFTEIFPAPDGQQHHCLVIKFPVPDESGRRLLGGIAIDITERKRIEARSRLQAQLLNAVGQAVIATDLSGAILYWNHAAETVFGWPADEAMGRDIVDVTVPEITTVEGAQIMENLRRGETWSGEFVVQRRDRTQFVVFATDTPFFDEAGELAGIVGISTDITERKRAEAALQRTKEEAERANRAKSEFISRMSHELRTPLNAILGFSQLFDVTKLDADERENVAEILRAGRHLLALINEVLDISRIESGQMSLSLEAVDVREVLDEVIGLTKPMAADRRIRVETATLNSCHVLADRQRLKQVLLNLVSNAIKYNREDGSTTLSWQETSEAESETSTTPATPQVRIEVTDTGAGIAAQDLDKIFEPFERLGMERRGIEGSGIGLGITRRLVELMGGEISVSSVVGQGSTFRMELPRMDDPLSVLDVASSILDSTIGAPGAVSHHRKTVLYIEDNLSNLKLIERILIHRPEINLIAAMQGRMGIDLAREHHPDLILLDLHLPDINGDEVLQRLRSDPETQSTPVVMLSADATPGQVVRLLAGGARNYLTKPLNVPRFLQILEEIFTEGGVD